MSEKITTTAKKMLAKHNLTLIQFLNWFTQGKIEGEVIYTLENVEDFIFQSEDLGEYALLFKISPFELAEPMF